MQQGVWPGSRLGQSGSAGGGAWLRPSQSGCSRGWGLALPQPIQMQQRWGLGPGQSGCSRAPSQPIRMRQGVGPGPHWQARGLRAAFVRLPLFARAGVGAMASGLMSCLAARLGIAEPEVLRKAEEYLRLSQVKCAGLSARTTETSSAVMCLDLAASCGKCPLDRAYLIKLSGLNKKMYQSCLKSFECLLGLKSSIGIRDLAVQFSCTEAVNMASKILQSYKSSLPQTQQLDLDLSRPLFTTAALLSACKILKLKVDKNKMVATSGVKKAVFDRLCKQLEKIGQQADREAGDSATPPKKKKKTMAETPARETEKIVESPCKLQKDEDLTQDYEEWKRKILENAAKAQKATAE
ncbi:origin recognition complex subunit 6 isoform X3 [Canis lupus familiaris]|uniref:Origin recognition complex subunit 6 n=3 Tax=Canis lupus familiaris TaxID=9615 RepID=A0A8P0N6I6_CANLF|nr:origin recognition complex subunit 6 isoform X3 [Canis lupus familiaris]XP_539609.3 origin recognition complex subunit 6 isoform X3 [Canis lupus familiaris]|eukprot:XP_539609.3 origin recognition complex subunit 6 isoform X3 [Canis lupus familiaris]